MSYIGDLPEKSSLNDNDKIELESDESPLKSKYAKLTSFWNYIKSKCTGHGSGVNADKVDGIEGVNLEFKQSLNAIRQNLGSPTVAEMALFQSQFSNKLRFQVPILIEESLDNGLNWSTSTNILPDSNLIKDMMTGDGVTGGFNISRGKQIRLTWQSDNYCFLNYLYLYWTTVIHSCRISIEKMTYEGNVWSQVCLTDYSTGWPAHVSIPHTYIPFAPTYHNSKVRITFIPAWSNDSASPYYNNPIVINSIEWWGGYPAGRRNIFSVNRDKDVEFPANVSAKQLISRVPPGFPPLIVESTNMVNKLKAQTAEVSDYGVSGSYSRIRSNEDGTNKWQLIGEIYMAYNASYQYGHSIDVELLVKEVSPDTIIAPQYLEDFKIYLKANLATCTSNTTFNSTVPDLFMKISGNTALSGSDFALLVRTSNTNSKYISLYIRTLESKKQYEILPMNRYGKSYTSSYTHTRAYCYFNLVGDQPFVSSLPTPVQGYITTARNQDGVKNIVFPDIESNTFSGINNFVAGESHNHSGNSCVNLGFGNTVVDGLGNIVNGINAYIPGSSPFRRAFNNTVLRNDFNTNCSQFQMSNPVSLFNQDVVQLFPLSHYENLNYLYFIPNSVVGITLKIVCVVCGQNGTVERAVGSINGWVDLANQEFLFDSRCREVIANNTLNSASVSLLDSTSIHIDGLSINGFNMYIKTYNLKTYAQSMGFTDASDLGKESFNVFFNAWVDAYELGNIPSGLEKGK